MPEHAFRGDRLPHPTAWLLATRVRRRCLAPRAWRVYDVVPVLAGPGARGWRHVTLSNHVPKLPALVDALGLGPLVDGVVTSAQVGYEKPHTEIFWIALRAAGGAGVPAILIRRQDASVGRRFAERHGVPTPAGRAFTDPREARRYAARLGGRCAVKADGLARGKGVVARHHIQEADRAIEEALCAGPSARRGRRS